MKIVLTTFCQEAPQMLHAKFGANWSNRLEGLFPLDTCPLPYVHRASRASRFHFQF